MKTSDVGFNNPNITDSRRREVFAALSTLSGMYPEQGDAVVKDAEGNLYSCKRDRVSGYWSVYDISKQFRDGFLLNADERETVMVRNATISAIKSLRTRLGLGLYDAKMHIDFFKRQYGTPDTNDRGCTHFACSVVIDHNRSLCNRCGSYC